MRLLSLAAMSIALLALPSLASAAKSVTVPDPTAPGPSVNGAIFIREDGGYGRCSGTSAVAPNRSLVITAGHCVFDEGHWSGRRWVFVPGYRHGERPFGTFIADWLGTTPQWRRAENDNFDVGAAVVGRNERGELLAQAVGADRLVTGRHPRTFDVYGYPVARPFNGGTLQVCQGAARRGPDLEALLMPGPLELGVSCRISDGASGGGWFIDGDLLNGVTSSSYYDDPVTDYGPYFGDAVARLAHVAGRIR
ncbi:MAG TPA: hypothetical protein VH476_06760 [Solirubrobacterales bacterium]|jgi:hypothetical protein